MERLSNWKEKAMLVGAGYALAMFWVLVVEIIYHASFGSPPYSPEINIYQIITSLFLAPFGEELIYRVVPLTLAKRYFSDHLMVVMLGASAIFGIMHGSILNLPVQGVLGVIFSVVYMRCGYLYAVLLHFLWNFSLVIGLLNYDIW